MAQQDNTLLLVALGGLAFYFWQRGNNTPAPVAIANADAGPVTTRPRGYRLRPDRKPPTRIKPMPPIRNPYQSPPFVPPVYGNPPAVACGNTLGVPCTYVEPVIDYYTPDRTVA